MLQRAAVSETADSLKAMMRREAPRGDHGGAHGADQIDYVIEQGLTGPRVRFYAPRHIGWVITGTKPHTIEAGILTGKSDSRVLHFFVGGQEVFTPVVHHPGTQPNDFRKKAWSKLKPSVAERYRGLGMSMLRGNAVGEEMDFSE